MLLTQPERGLEPAQDVSQGTSGGPSVKTHPAWTPAFTHTLCQDCAALLSAQLSRLPSPGAYVLLALLPELPPRPWAQAGAYGSLNSSGCGVYLWSLGQCWAHRKLYVMAREILLVPS